jgi:hypothetical protein
MAIRTAQFKSGVRRIGRPASLSCHGFLAIVPVARKAKPRSEKKRP